MRDSPVLTRFVGKLQGLTPPTQAPTHQSQPAGNLTIEYCVVNIVNATTATVGTVPAMSCQITYKGSTQNVGWIGPVPGVGQNLLLVQPPVSYVVGMSSVVNAGEAWIPAVLQNGWVPFGGSGSAAPPGYRLVGDRVEFRGSAKSGTTTGNTTLFTLPSAYCPKYTVNAVGQAGGTGTWIYDILSSGTVFIEAGASAAQICFDDTSFSIST